MDVRIQRHVGRSAVAPRSPHVRGQPWRRVGPALLGLGLCGYLGLGLSGCGKQDKQEPVTLAGTASAGKTQIDHTDPRALMDRANRVRTSRHTPRRYARKPLPGTARALISLAAEYDEATDAKSREKILDALAEYCDPGALPIIEKALRDASADVRTTALEALEGYTSKDVVPLVMKGLLDGSVHVRVAAMEALACVEHPAAVEPIALAFTDTDADVREAAFDSMEELDYSSRLTLLEEALHVPAKDMRLAAISELEDISNHDAMDLIIEGMRDDDAEVREETSSAIWFLVSEEFKNYETARRWWTRNRHRFDEELFEKD